MPARRDELTLIETFLAIEEVRFGDRLRRSLDVSDDALAMSVPALLLQQALQRIAIREGSRVHDYLVIASGGKQYRKQQTLAQLETQLNPSRFARIHRSFLLNVERIARIEPYAKDSWQVFLSDGSHLPMSRSGYQRLRTVLD
jgi:two-component system LytT family response regulator